MDASKLANRDYYVLIDKSGSMSTRDCPGGKTRWSYAEESTEALARKCNEFDPDGITVVPFSSAYRVYENTTPEKVADVFKENEPIGSTNLTDALQWTFDNHLKQKTNGTLKANGSMVVVITDGQPDDENGVARSIVNFTKQIPSRDEFGLSFVQIGSDAHARDYLERLDSHLSTEGAKLDIVNAKTMADVEKVGMIETLLSALTQ